MSCQSAPADNWLVRFANFPSCYSSNGVQNPLLLRMYGKL
ncbi:unnamed protein product, partial [Staurois parvus]